MRILLVANHFAVASGRYMTDALKRLGHDVKTMGKCFGQNIWGMTVGAQYIWQPDYAYETPIRGWSPELIIVADSDPAVLHYADQYLPGRFKGVPIIVWGVDNHVREYRRPSFAHYFLAHKAVTVMPYQKDMTFLPCGYDPIAFTPSQIPWQERQYDAALIGVMYRSSNPLHDRWTLYHALKEAGLKVFVGTGLVYDQMAAIYHNARVALCPSFNGDLPIRVFEGAGMGCQPVADNVGDLERINNQWGWVLTYESIPDAVEQVRGIAYDIEPEMGNRASTDLVNWAQGHTWDVRAQRVMAWREEWSG